jgi:CHAT domain-containing protein
MKPNRIVLAEYFTTDDLTLLFGVRADWDEPQVVEIQRPLSSIRTFVTQHFGPTADGNHTIRNLDLDEWQYEFNEFIAPIKDWSEPGDYLYLVPHDVLHYLPLHALKLDGQYLIERNPVLYTPSASVLKYCQAKRKGRRDRALVMGDSYGDLVHARAEALAVAQGFGTQAHLGQAAKKSLVQNLLKEDKESIDILHFACHGRFHHTQPLKSGILMASETNDMERSEFEPMLGDLPVSNFLTAEDFFGMEMQADLVTLSACESGVSEIRPGDELFGLMRALIYAGTPSVVMSLWSVDQISSGIFMQKFYKTLKNPETTKVKALQTAQLAVKETTVQEAIDYCQEAAALLENAGEVAALQALTEDMADLHYQAYNYTEATKNYETLLDKLDPGAETDKYRSLDVAVTRCKLLTGEPQQLDYKRKIYSHPYHWAPFILVGDWQ